MLCFAHGEGVSAVVIVSYYRRVRSTLCRATFVQSLQHDMSIFCVPYEIQQNYGKTAEPSSKLPQGVITRCAEPQAPEIGA